MLKINLDSTDTKILHLLDYNSRSPVSLLAKKLHVSRDIVAYRMKKFSENQVLLKYYTIIDIAKLGYAAHKNFIRFQNMTEKREAEFIAFVKSHPSVVYSASYDGRFDSVVSIWSRNMEELAATLRELERKFSDVIAERQMATIIRGEYCVRNYLSDKQLSRRRESFFGSTPQHIKIDDINKKILFELGKDARVTSVEIANKLNLSVDTICQRFRKLEKSGIIQGYTIVPNEEIYPFSHYKILISLHNVDNPQEKRLQNYCRNKKSIWYFCTCLGSWNFEIDCEVASAEEFRIFLRDFKVIFSDIIKDYTVLTVYKTNKYNFCPSIPQLEKDKSNNLK